MGSLILSINFCMPCHREAMSLQTRTAAPTPVDHERDIDFSSEELRGDIPIEPLDSLTDPVNRQDDDSEDDCSPELLHELLDAHDEEPPVKTHWQQIFAGAAATVFGTGIISLVAMTISNSMVTADISKDVKSILDNKPITAIQYERDMNTVNQKLDKMDRRQSAMECRQQKQLYKAAGINFDCDILSDSNP